MMPRRLLPWLFALTLLLGQTAAFAHALSHLDPHDAALADKVCEVCIAQATLGSAAPVALSSLPVEPVFHARQAVEAPIAVPARSATRKPARPPPPSEIRTARRAA